MLLHEMYDDYDNNELACCPVVSCQYETRIPTGQTPDEYTCPTHKKPLVSDAEKDDIEYEYDKQLVSRADDNEEDLFRSQGY